MRTLLIRHADARRLVEMLAGKWAHRTTHLAGADVRIDNPIRSAAGPYATPLKVDSIRRAYEVERDWIGRVLAGLGVVLPEVSPLAPIVIAYDRHGRTTPPAFNRAAAQEEAKRIKAAIEASFDVGAGLES